MEPLKSYNRMTDGAMEPMEQALTYYRALSRGGEGAAFYCHKGEERVSDSGKAYSPVLQYCTRDEESFKQQYLRNWESDSYITVNQFTGEYRYDEGAHKRGWFRKEKDCCAINGILLDFDIMKGKEVRENYTVEEGGRIVREVLFKVSRLVEEGAMVKPTLVTLSGRGIQMLLLYGESISTEDTEAMYKHKRLYSHIVGFLQGYFDKDYVEVDTSVRDYSRICRLPGTMHTKNACLATLQEVNACLYDVDGLCEFFGVDLAPEEKKKPGRKAKKAVSLPKQAPRRRSYEPVLDKTKPAMKKSNIINFEEKLIERRNIKGKIAALEKLAENRGMSEGDKREITLHIYYSLQRQVKKAEEAAEYTKEFNGSFAEPLPECVINALIKNADTHTGGVSEYMKEVDGKLVSAVHQYPSGYYESSREGIVEMLGMTEEEIAYTGITKRQMEKERARINNAAKAEHLERLIAMLKKGEREAVIVKEYMTFSGKSRATAYRWVEKAKAAIEEEAKQAEEKKAAETTEIEETLSHFGVNTKKYNNREKAKGSGERVFSWKNDNRKENGDGVLTVCEEDELFVYMYSKMIMSNPRKCIRSITETWTISQKDDRDCIKDAKLKSTVKRKLDLEGNLLSEEVSGWYLHGKAETGPLKVPLADYAADIEFGAGYDIAG